MLGDPGQKEQGIIQSEIDLATGRLITKPRLIWTGTGGSFPEGPHLYHIGDAYYLMIAEGGTEYGHCECIARSDSPWGPWESCPHNPIFTHRSTSSPIQAVGHADMLEAADGSWWAVCLGVRPVFPQAQHLGRETFLAPVTWDEHGWPHFGIGGRIELEMESPHLVSVPWDLPPERDDFEPGKLGMKWNFLGVPTPDSWSLTRRQGALCLQGSGKRLDDGMGVSWVGCRQEHFNCEAATLLDFNPADDSEEAGITIWKDPRHHYDLFVTRERGRRVVRVRRRIGSLSAVVAEKEIPDGQVTLQVRANRLFYSFIIVDGAGGEQWLSFGETRYLSTEVAGGFTGVYFGLYASGGRQAAPAPAFFDWFDYREIEKPGLLSVDSSIAMLLGNDESRQVLGRHFPGLVAHPPAEWGARLSFLGLAATMLEDFPPEKILAVDAELQKRKIHGQEETLPAA